MLNHDDLLQKKLSELENGAALDAVLRDLPAEAKELEMLVRLAAAVRDAPHPVPAASQVSAQRREVLAAAVRNTQPASAHASAGAAARRPAWNWLTAGALLAAAGAMALFFALVLLGAGFWFSSRGANTVKVENLNGQVQVATDKAGTSWKNIETGARLHAGARLRTLGASNATLVFFEGTHTFVSPNSELTFSEIKGSAGSTLQVKIDQAAGETWNKVIPFKENTRSYFLVQTPSGTASVRGTSFNVKVSKSGQAQFTVNTGEVRVKNSAEEVTLLAGQATIAGPGGEIAAPTYQFSIQGSLLSMDIAAGGMLWTVSGAQFKVTDATEITGEPQLGDTIHVSGRILEGDAWVADTIEPGTDEGQAATYTGKLEKNEGEFWIIGGRAVKVTPETGLDPRLAINDPVKVTYNIINDGNTWLALEIESLVEPVAEPAPTPTATSDPHAMPSYEFDPDELETQACGESEFDFTGTLRNTANEAKDYAANVQLGYRFDRGGDFVSSVDLAPSGWTRIEAGQAVTFNIHVTMADEWAERAGKGGAESKDLQVKMRVFVESATNRPDHLNGRLTVTIEAGCQAAPTRTVTGTPTVTPTGTLTPEITATLTATPTVESPEPGQCVGAEPQPTGMKLAQRYGVPYEEIMGWFCQHYGFGEIDLAYSLSRQTGIPVEEIFAMRASGMGWGDIKKTLLNGDNNQDNSGNGKDKDKKDKKKDK